MSPYPTPEQKAAKAEYDRERRSSKKDSVASARRAYYLANQDKENARVAAWVAANRSQEIKQAWKDRNPEYAPSPASREVKAAYMREFRVQRPEVHKSNMRLRRRGVSQATPQWADKDAIKAIYVKARSQGMHADHVIPLQGKNVRGLHTESNLRPLPPEENRRKSNKFTPEEHHAY